MGNFLFRRAGNVGFLCLLLAGVPALAQEREALASEPPDFLDPLIGEAPIPETDFRLDHRYRNLATGTEHALQLTAEYAFTDWFSFELGVPVTYLDPDNGAGVSNLGTVEIEMKFMPFVFPARGLVFAGGLEIGLPTGDESKAIGSNREWELEPFLNAGWQVRGLQMTAQLSFGIPMNQSEEEADEVDLEIGFNLAFLYPLSPDFVPLLEFDGQGVAKGTDNKTVINATIGFLSTPFKTEDLKLGFGISAPLTSDEDFDIRTIFTVFYEL